MAEAFDRENPPTRWSQILQLHGAAAGEAWQFFITTYSGFVAERLYVRGRRRGMVLDRPRVVIELLPEFWSYAWRRKIAQGADSARRFRSFLCGCFDNFLSERHKENARSPLPLDPAAPMAHPAPTIEWEDQREFAMDTLRRGLERLREEDEVKAQALQLFYGIGSGRTMSGNAVGAALCVTHVHKLLARARNRLRTIVVSLLRECVTDDEGLAQEIGDMHRALAGEYPGLFTVANGTIRARSGEASEEEEA